MNNSHNVMNLNNFLSQEERLEVAKQPQIYLTLSNRTMRENIGKKINDYLRDRCLFEDEKHLYDQYPLWQVYESNGHFRRVYGFIIQNGIPYAKVITALHIYNAISNIPCFNLKPIDISYNTRIAQTATPENFVDPLGFLRYIDTNVLFVT